MSSVFVCLFRLQRRACTDNQPRCHTATAECPVILVLKLCDAGAKSACKWCRQSEIYRIVGKRQTGIKKELAGCELQDVDAC